MDIRVTSTNKIFYQIDSGLAALLCEAFPASFEPVNRPALRPHPANANNAVLSSDPTPHWSVAHSATGFLTITVKTPRTGFAYAGSVEGATEHFKRAGFDLPKAVLDEYAAMKGAEKDPEWLHDQRQNQIADRAIAQGGNK